MSDNKFVAELVRTINDAVFTAVNDPKAREAWEETQRPDTTAVNEALAAYVETLRDDDIVYFESINKYGETYRRDTWAKDLKIVAAAGPDWSKSDEFAERQEAIEAVAEAARVDLWSGADVDVKAVLAEIRDL